MPAQAFFYETPHANFGMYFNEDSEANHYAVADMQEKANALDESNKNIYKVVAQYSTNADGVQIFVAPYTRYVDLAMQILNRFKETGKVYFKDKNDQIRQIKKQEFIHELTRIVNKCGSNLDLAVTKTIALIKDFFESHATKLEKAVEKIADEYGMGVVKYQEYYRGLADTWIEKRDQKGIAAFI